MKKDPIHIALWRFEKISMLLDSRLTPGERSRMIKEMSRIPVIWPNGDEGPINRSTIYRWLKAYRENPVIESLLPKPKPEKSKKKRVIREEWVQYALALLEEEPDRSFFILTNRIQQKFNLETPIAKSSLHREMQHHQRYMAIRRRAVDKGGRGRLRKRFQALNPHEIWHGDAIGPFPVIFSDGKTKKFSILSILDDATRFILAAIIILSENIAGVVSTFRKASSRYGLCQKWYADRGSAYDSDVFRKGLGILGIHRIRTRAGNASAHGKIEAYHRSLRRWFIKELKHQQVLDELHLQQLLDATIDKLYHEHIHRELKMTPRQAFRNRMSQRKVSLERLRDAFLIEKKLKPHKKTGELNVGKEYPLFRVPREHLSPKVYVAIDPENPDTAFIKCKNGHLVPLPPAIVHEEKKVAPRKNEPVGPLTPLLDEYRGRSLPQASAGFGLPEIYEAFSEVLMRPVPVTEKEAISVVEWLERCGPFSPDAFHAALLKTIERLGNGRPLSQIISVLETLTKRGVK